jgi:hypothetical protein
MYMYVKFIVSLILYYLYVTVDTVTIVTYYTKLPEKGCHDG